MAQQPHPFLYWDQLVIDEKYKRQGIALSLAAKLISIALTQNIPVMLGAISHKPFRNEPSISLVKKLGFQLHTEFETQNGLCFGIYLKKL